MADELAVLSLPLPVAPGSNPPPASPRHFLAKGDLRQYALAGSGVQGPSGPCSGPLSGGAAGGSGRRAWFLVLPYDCPAGSSLGPKPAPHPPQLPLSALTTPGLGSLQCGHGDLGTWWVWGAWLPAHSVTRSFLETPGGHDPSDCSSAGNPRKTCSQTSAREEIGGNRGERFHSPDGFSLTGQNLWVRRGRRGMPACRRAPAPETRLLGAADAVHRAPGPLLRRGSPCC